LVIRGDTLSIFADQHGTLVVKIRNIFGNDRRDDRLHQLLHAADERDRMYVTRLNNDGDPVGDPILNCTPFPELFPYLRDNFGGGDFRIMIRRRRVLLLAGAISIASPRQGA
jgi:hypothetical protein